MKIPKKMNLNQRTFYNQQSHLACWHIKICTSIRRTICESLEKIQHFRNECSSILYEIPKKTQKNQRTFHNLQLILAYQYTKMCVLIIHKICESLLTICATRLKCRSFLWCIFQSYGSVASSYQKTASKTWKTHEFFWINTK